jgi:hypothetical protein
MWFSDASGEVENVLIPCRVDGEIICVDTKPGGLLAPNYDISLTDYWGIDVMGGALANRSDMEAERAYPEYNKGLAYYITDGDAKAGLYLNITTGTAKGTYGYVNIYYRHQEEGWER